MKNKRTVLENLMKELTKKDCCVAFSGGVDSSLILRLALESAKNNQTKVMPVMFETVLHPSVDQKIAREVAGQLGVELHVLHVNELEDSRILKNPVNRCYLCKHMLFEKLQKFSKDHGIETILEGTNHDDTKQYRPGLQAVDELGIRSPLREAGLTKEEVREWARELGVAVADRPSTPCMATRLPYGTLITMETLKKIEAGEQYLRNLGFQNIRLRLHGDIVRLETDKFQFNKIFENLNDINDFLKNLGFQYITLDLEGFRSGSMDYGMYKEKNIENK